MSWEAIFIVLILAFIAHSIGQVERHAKQSAETLIEMSTTLDGISRQLGDVDTIQIDVRRLREYVVGTTPSWTESDETPDVP